MDIRFVSNRKFPETEAEYIYDELEKTRQRLTHVVILKKKFVSNIAQKLIKY
jgi:hypothetical protein